ncbi:MAG: hypothetical protein BTN85_0364 [Candidatus Methanohalarchaeum thermophilum]|uniref:Uncharacterized protein n=1 Tax=Methanohalarchaeum thermophilum TaxID=1903181 RepID=A0A1Q6DU82_METT1|nr:MAG: hypothetical protein BTN85_0364 [Candidatus Methanohalarchaeum thermophilum]
MKCLQSKSKILRGGFPVGLISGRSFGYLNGSLKTFALWGGETAILVSNKLGCEFNRLKSKSGRVDKPWDKASLYRLFGSIGRKSVMWSGNRLQCL